jgi:hypothetical protein
MVGYLRSEDSQFRSRGNGPKEQTVSLYKISLAPAIPVFKAGIGFLFGPAVDKLSARIFA